MVGLCSAWTAWGGQSLFINLLPGPLDLHIPILGPVHTTPSPPLPSPTTCNTEQALKRWIRCQRTNVGVHWSQLALSRPGLDFTGWHYCSVRDTEIALVFVCPHLVLPTVMFRTWQLYEDNTYPGWRIEQSPPQHKQKNKYSHFLIYLACYKGYSKHFETIFSSDNKCLFHDNLSPLHSTMWYPYRISSIMC